MVARILEQSEWSKVEHLDIAALAKLMKPENVQIIVVEADGQIVAAMGLVRMVHLEGTWVDPDYRNGGIVRALLRTMKDAAGRWGTSWVVTSADNDIVRGILERMDASRVEAESFVLPLSGKVH